MSLVSYWYDFYFVRKSQLWLLTSNLFDLSVQIWNALFTFVYIEFKHSHAHAEEARLHTSPSQPAVRVAKKELWIETIRSEPRIFVIHNLISLAECEHLISLAQEKGLKVSNM